MTRQNTYLYDYSLYQALYYFSRQPLVTSLDIISLSQRNLSCLVSKRSASWLHHTWNPLPLLLWHVKSHKTYGLNHTRYTYIIYIYKGWKWVTPVDPLEPLSNLNVTHTWPTCWSYLFNIMQMTWKNLLWNNAIDFLILGRISETTGHHMLQNSLK